MDHPSTLDPTIPAEPMEPTDPVERDRLLVEAEAEIEAGQGTPHADVQAWLSELAAGRDTPPPCGR